MPINIPPKHPQAEVRIIDKCKLATEQIERERHSEEYIESIRFTSGHVIYNIHFPMNHEDCYYFGYDY